MNVSQTVGLKIKQIRTKKNLTLKQLSEASGLSVGFLSQFERGLSPIALDSLEKLSSILGVRISDFFNDAPAQRQEDAVSHWVSLQPDEISPQIYQYFLGSGRGGFDLLPRVFLLMPFPERNTVPKLYAHEGEEFIFVLEGIIAVYVENRKYVLYPGDSIQIDSARRHNWMNETNKVAKILTVNSPNPLRQAPKPGVQGSPFPPDVP